MKFAGSYIIQLAVQIYQDFFRVVDIGFGTGGSVIDQLREYSTEGNAEFVVNAIKTLELNVPTFQDLIPPGGTPQILIRQLTTYSELTVYRALP